MNNRKQRADAKKVNFSNVLSAACGRGCSMRQKYEPGYNIRTLIWSACSDAVEGNFYQSSDQKIGRLVFPYMGACVDFLTICYFVRSCTAAPPGRGNILGGRPRRGSGGLSPPDAVEFSKNFKKFLKKIANNALF